jgi:hypothetical protein
MYELCIPVSVRGVEKVIPIILLLKKKIFVHVFHFVSAFASPASKA